MDSEDGDGSISLVKEDSGDVVLTVESYPADNLVAAEFFKMKIPVAEMDYSDPTEFCKDVCDYLMVGKIPASDCLLVQTRIRGTEAEKNAALNEALAR